MVGRRFVRALVTVTVNNQGIMCRYALRRTKIRLGAVQAKVGRIGDYLHIQKGMQLHYGAEHFGNVIIRGYH